MTKLAAAFALALATLAAAACGGNKQSSTTPAPAASPEGAAADARQEGMIPDDKEPLGTDGSETPGEGTNTDPAGGNQ